MPEVPISELRPTVDPATFPFETTAELSPHLGLIGQDRAIEALKFGLGIDSKGFNIVVTGEPGTGRSTAMKEYLEDFSQGKLAPDDWCYVNNFQDPYRPRALRFPSGKGAVFTNAMAAMVAEAREVIPRTFSSEDFVNRRDHIIQSVQRGRSELFADLAEQATQAGFQLQGNPQGFFLVPLLDDKPMDDAAFGSLTPEARAELMQRRDALMEKLKPLAKQGQGEETEAEQRLSELQHSVATHVVDTLVERFFEDYEVFPEVIQYMLEVRRDMIDHVQIFLPQPVPPTPVPGPLRDPDLPFRKYKVNLLIDCAGESCARVISETNPTPQHLFGTIEKEALFGAVTTDFTMIRPGSMHRANGGYLVFDFDDLLVNPLSWMVLKRTLRTGEITIEELGDRLGYIETKTIRPEPIPWTGKVVCIARESVYRMLYVNDPDFRELFKVKANFDMRIERTPANEQDYAGLISAVTKKEGLLPLDRGAVARIVEEGMRMAEDHNKLSILFGEICDIVREAVHWARMEGATVVNVQHVRKAVHERKDRVDLIEENNREAMLKDIIVIDTTGESVGQVNGLSVIDLGDTAFGLPNRITATVGVGREGVLDLLREVQMSGPIHQKAVLTLQGFLVDRYAVDTPLTLAARISFEQSYGMVEGDSATCAETCALLSRLADLPVKQSFAITGSMDQKGEVQAIGGANHKIEGFFDVCSERGLTGEQGVILPASNVQHLMLREDVVEAVAAGRFRVHAVSTVDEALELLTGIPAGKQGPDGTYPPDSVNGLVQAKLLRFASQLQAFSGHHAHIDEVDEPYRQVQEP